MMAERRMFAKTIIDSDAFLDMPTSARLLYYDLSMRADDDGFINSPKKIIRMTGASDDDLKVLIAKKFVIPFENGIVVIKHWKIHNYIAKDRYTETKYKEEKAMLKLDENNAYTLSEGKPLNLIEKTKQPLSEARQKRLDVKKESDLPYSFEYKIRNAFVGEKCPICGCTMNYENNLTKPTIQHNKPISLGGKHEIDNISVICNSCNSSIQNRVETPPYNTALVKEKWECIGNVSGMSTQDRLGKVSIGKDNIYGQNDQEYEAKFEKFYNKYPKKVKKQEVKKWFLKNKPSNELFSSMMNSLEQFRASKDWQKDGGQFIPYPSTWLNQKRWEDETEKPQKDEWLEGWLKQDD
jgi:hypothetical protein